MMANEGWAACSVNSSNGYTVHMDVYPEAIEPSTDNCPWGYNYRVRMRYAVSFTGSNIPGSLYTLQGNVTCGSTSIFFDLPNNGGSGTVLSSNAWTSMTNCATTTPNSLGCFSVSVQIEGPSLSSRTINCSFSPLPIELIGFNAKDAGNAVELTWATASESNNDYFSIERSTDGDAFEVIERISGAGNSTVPIHYRAYDRSPKPAVSYYRLRQTDQDGTTTLSPIVAVHRRVADNLLLMPNPFSTGMLTAPQLVDGAHIEIRGANGKLLASWRASSSSLDMPSLPPGVYHVRAVDANGVFWDARLAKE